MLAKYDILWFVQRVATVKKEVRTCNIMYVRNYLHQGLKVILLHATVAH